MNCPNIQAGKCTLGVFQVVRSRTGREGAGRESLWTKEDGQVSSGVICRGGKVSDTSRDFPAHLAKLVGEWQMMTAIHEVSSLVLLLHPY